MKAYEVWLDEKLIDTVFFLEDMSLSEVWSSLVNHDGYSEDIIVMGVK